MAAVWTPSLPGVRASRATPVLKKRHVVLLFAAVGVVSFVVLLSKQHSLARQQRRVEVIAPYAQLRWSLSGVTPVAPDLALSPEAILVPRSGETRRFEFVKTEPVVDNPPRAECAQHDVVACEVRNQNGVLSVRAIANDRCFFQEAEGTSDFGKWVGIAKHAASEATNRFFPDIKVQCALEKEEQLSMTAALHTILDDGRLTAFNSTEPESTCSTVMNAEGKKTIRSQLCDNGFNDQGGPDMSPPKQGEEDNRWTSNCVYCVYFQSAGFPIGTLFRWDAYSNNAQWHLSKRKCGLSAGLPVQESLAHLSIEEMIRKGCYKKLPKTIARHEMDELATELNTIAVLANM